MTVSKFFTALPRVVQCGGEQAVAPSKVTGPQGTRSCAQDPVSVLRYLTVGGDEAHPFHAGLRDQDAVEGVPVERWQALHREVRATSP